MRITRWGEYGILCCMYLARRLVPPGEASGGAAVGASEIADQQGIPTQYAQQILHRLRKGGVIKSVRGPHGGFLLNRPPEQINLYEILLAAEGHTFELICENDPIYPETCNPAAIEKAIDNSADQSASDNSSASESATVSIPQTFAARQQTCESVCGLKEVWQELRDVVNKLLESKTLAMLVAADRRTRYTSLGGALKGGAHPIGASDFSVEGGSLRRTASSGELVDGPRNTRAAKKEVSTPGTAKNGAH